MTKTLTPQEIRVLAVATDTRLAELHEQDFALRRKLEYTAQEIGGIIRNDTELRTKLVKFAKHFPDKVLPLLQENGINGYYLEQATAALTRIAFIRAGRKEIGHETHTLNEIYNLHKWTRFFIVRNANGHIHRTMTCHTCFDDTLFGWLPQLGGLTDADAVADQGEILCTICFPDAPVAWTNGVAKKTLEERAARDAQKAERQAKKLAKALLPDGTTLKVGTDRLATLAAAKMWLTDTTYYRKVAPHVEWATAEDFQKVVQAVANKETKTVEQVIAEAVTRANKRN